MPTPEEVQKLIENSGNSFHAKVARWFSENGWHVIVSPYYMDQVQAKAREIDLVVETCIEAKDSFDRFLGYIGVRLIVECKFVAATSVFWFAQKDHSAAKDLVCADGHFRDNNTYTNEHHYLSQSPRVAKLFASTSNKNAENEPFYKALNQSLSAMVSLRGKELTHPKVKKYGGGTLHVLEFPVVICSSFKELYEVDFYADSEPSPIKDNFQLEVRYAYIDRNNSQRDEHFLLDFVEIGQIESFITAIQHDAELAVFFAAD